MNLENLKPVGVMRPAGYVGRRAILAASLA
jgi:hypothetical protein